MTYEPPAIHERAEIGGPLIGTAFIGSAPISPAWRRTEDAPQEESP